MIAGVAAKRMNREQFFRAASGLDEDRLRKALWNLYWRGTANMRERIEAELASAGRARPARKIKPPADPDIVGWEVDEFVSLARSGAYLGGDRRVSPRERSRWRFTFKRLAAEAQDALRAEDAEPAASALEQLIDLAREADGYDYFRSDDPVAAAGFVVSDVAAAGHPHFRGLPCRPFRFKAKRAQDGVRVGHAAVQQASCDVVLAQWAMFGQDSRHGLGRIERFGHGGHLMPRPAEA